MQLELAEKARRKPGRAIRIIREGWYWWSWACGAIGLAYLPSWGLVTLFFDGHNPVSVHTGQRLLTPRVSLGGDLVYEVTVDRRRPCKGVVVDMFEASGPVKVQVIRERPVMSDKMENNRRLRTAVPLPPSLSIGPARFKETLVSDCPEGKVEDVIFATDFVIAEPGVAEP